MEVMVAVESGTLLRAMRLGYNLGRKLRVNYAGK
jgi:hypothetical protein